MSFRILVLHNRIQMMQSEHKDVKWGKQAGKNEKFSVTNIRNSAFDLQLLTVLLLHGIRKSHDQSHGLLLHPSAINQVHVELSHHYSLYLCVAFGEGHQRWRHRHLIPQCFVPWVPIGIMQLLKSLSHITTEFCLSLCKRNMTWKTLVFKFTCISATSAHVHSNVYLAYLHLLKHAAFKYDKEYFIYIRSFCRHFEKYSLKPISVKTSVCE